jgi:hypothetical protein
MTKKDYKKYLFSKDWLLLKNKLINIYLKQKWNIECLHCGSEKALQVHHFSYENIGKEILEDERINELGFLCADCHFKWHKTKNFKEGFYNKIINEINYEKI